MLFRNRCYNGGNRHEFKSVYEERLNVDGSVGYWHPSANEFRKMFFDKVYVYDICKWCGKRIKRND